MRKESRDRRKGDGIGKNIAKALFSDQPHLEFISNTEVTIEGCKGVLEYNENTIRINTPPMLICFHGRGLNLRCISQTALIIEGFLSDVEFIV